LFQFFRWGAPGRYSLTASIGGCPSPESPVLSTARADSKHFLYSVSVHQLDFQIIGLRRRGDGTWVGDSACSELFTIKSNRHQKGVVQIRVEDWNISDSQACDVGIKREIVVQAGVQYSCSHTGCGVLRQSIFIHFFAGSPVLRCLNFDPNNNESSTCTRLQRSKSQRIPDNLPVRSLHRPPNPAPHKTHPWSL